MAEVGAVDELVAAGRFAEAAAEARRQLATAPDDPDLLMALARALSRAGDAGAITFAERALAMRPDDVGFNVSMADVYRSARLFRPAVERARHAVELSPDTAAPQLALAWASPSVDWEAGAAAASRALDLAPDSPDALRVRSIYTSPIRAVHLLERAVALRPVDVELRAEYARALQKAGLHEKARHVLLDTVTAHPERPDLSGRLVAAGHLATEDVRRTERALRPPRWALVYAGMLATIVSLLVSLVL